MSTSMKAAADRLRQAQAVLDEMSSYKEIPAGEGEENPTQEQLLMGLALTIDRAERPYRPRKRRR